MSRNLTTLRCPSDGRALARLEVDDAGHVWFLTVGGKRGDLIAGREWADAKGRASWLGVLGANGEQVGWWAPTPENPDHVEAGRMQLPSATQVANEPLLREAVALPIRVVCPHCHRVYGAQLSVSQWDGWTAVLASNA